MGKKETKRFTKQLRKEIDAVTAGTRYNLDAKTGEITKEGQTAKQQREAQLDKFCDDARKAAEQKPEESVQAPSFEAEPELTPEGQRTAQKRAALSQVLSGLGLYK